MPHAPGNGGFDAFGQALPVQRGATDPGAIGPALQVSVGLQVAQQLGHKKRVTAGVARQGQAKILLQTLGLQQGIVFQVGGHESLLVGAVQVDLHAAGLAAQLGQHPSQGLLSISRRVGALPRAIGGYEQGAAGRTAAGQVEQQRRAARVYPL